VELIFKTSDAFIVDPVGDGTRQVWAVDARVVHAVLASPQELTGP
jgi:hypothetical protein